MSSESSESPEERPVEIPYTDLAPETLRNLIEDLVTRDGTDYGAVEKTLEQKADALMRQLHNGEAKLVFDLTTESIGLMTAAQLKRSKVQEPSEDTQPSEDPE